MCRSRLRWENHTLAPGLPPNPWTLRLAHGRILPVKKSHRAQLWEPCADRKVRIILNNDEMRVYNESILRYSSPTSELATFPCLPSARAQTAHVNQRLDPMGPQYRAVYGALHSGLQSSKTQRNPILRICHPLDFKRCLTSQRSRCRTSGSSEGSKSVSFDPAKVAVSYALAKDNESRLGLSSDKRGDSCENSS